jgi:hypothetical protein
MCGAWRARSEFDCVRQRHTGVFAHGDNALGLRVIGGAMRQAQVLEWTTFGDLRCVRSIT